MFIDVFSDPICPWCFIGKRRFEAAASERRGLDLKLRWRCFQLNPDMPREGLPRQEYLSAKFGGASGAAQVYDRVIEAGHTVGIDFAFDRIERTPNTVQAHRLIRLAQQAEVNRADALTDALFDAYFLEGEDIGDRDVLAEIAARAGIDRDEALHYLQGDHDRAVVLEEDAAARRAGIQGVPCFIVGGRYAIAGAHEPATLLEVIDRAAGEAEAAG